MNGQQLYRHWMGEDSSKENEVFQNWLDANPSHKWEYLDLQHVWENARSLPDDNVRDLGIQDFTGIRSRIDNARRQVKLFNLILGFSIFAILIAVLGGFLARTESTVQLEVKNELLVNTCEKLHQAYGMDIKVAPSIQACQINGTFLGDRSDSVLYRMARNFHWQCYKRGDTFFIDGKTCQN